VTTADAHAWPEVDLAGYGWVAFEPTDFTHAPPKSGVNQPPETGGENKRADTPNPGNQPTVDPTLTKGPGTRARVIAGTLIGLAVLALLLILFPFVVAFEKVRRRSRRRHGSRSARIIGAWRDVTDRLVERGVGVPRSLTAREVALRAEAELGEPAVAVAVLAPIVTAAIFSPEEPDDEAVREAWELNTKLRRDLR